MAREVHTYTAWLEMLVVKSEQCPEFFNISLCLISIKHKCGPCNKNDNTRKGNVWRNCIENMIVENLMLSYIAGLKSCITNNKNVVIFVEKLILHYMAGLTLSIEAAR